MRPINYYELPGLENIYLEDSYVLDIQISNTSAQFLLDLVITKNHPKYKHPSPKEQYCYKKSWLQFNQLKEFNWIKKIMYPYRDANEEIDYGNIDALIFLNEKYNLYGDWGEIEIISAPPIVEIID